MVVVDGIKYACEQCIRGHRVSGCNHVDKPLTMIKKKGRPATHCSHCRKAKPGKPARGASSPCLCGYTRHERTVITPKDLRALQMEYGIRVELTDGSLLPPLDAESSTDYSAASSTATPATMTDSPPVRSPRAPSEKHIVTAPRPPSSLASSSSAAREDFNPYDPIDSSSSYSRENSVDASAMNVLASESAGRYGRTDAYLGVPAFQYEAGFLGQPYSAALYSSSAGNNTAAAEANAGGESTAAVASVGHAANAPPFMGMITDEAKEHANFGRAPQLLLSAMPHHSLLSTTSQDLEASMSALAPLTSRPAPGAGPGPVADIDREELVGSILRSSSAQPSPEVSTGKAELKEAGGSGKDENDEGYSSVQAMPELSSLY